MIQHPLAPPPHAPDTVLHMYESLQEARTPYDFQSITTRFQPLTAIFTKNVLQTTSLLEIADKSRYKNLTAKDAYTQISTSTLCGQFGIVVNGTIEGRRLSASFVGKAYEAPTIKVADAYGLYGDFEKLLKNAANLVPRLTPSM